MSLLKLFSGPTPENLETKGDTLFAAGQWGQAKLAYERALHKLEQTAGTDTGRHRQLQDKIQQTCEALARNHHKDALNYLDGGYPNEAREALTLAMEISRDKAFRDELADQLAALDDQPDAALEPIQPVPIDRFTLEDTSLTPAHRASKEEYFRALCHTLPEDVGQAYQSYGEDFVDGYIALNSGQFEVAMTHLEQALAVNPDPGSYIPLELATAYMNNNRLAEARDLLEQVRLHHPEALPAYQLLCEIYWEQDEMAQAEALLASLPPHLLQSRAVMHLKGETLFRSGHVGAARDFYRDYLETFGWHDTMAKELAKAYEVLNERSEARDLYQEIMGRCQGCHARVDPWIKHKYAELSFAEGHKGADILELYLSLAREVPDNAAIYFDRISHIYFSQGNAAEGERFQAFARRAQAEQNLTTPS